MDAVVTFLRRYPDSPVIRDVLGTLDPAATRTHVCRDEAHLDELQGVQGAPAAAGFSAPRPLVEALL